MREIDYFTKRNRRRIKKRKITLGVFFCKRTYRKTFGEIIYFSHMKIFARGASEK